LSAIAVDVRSSKAAPSVKPENRVGEAKGQVSVAATLLIGIAVVVGLSVVGVGVAALVYFLTRDKNGSEVDPD
jgi:hypothetical protein